MLKLFRKAISDVIKRYRELCNEAYLMKRVVAHPFDYEALDALCKIHNKEFTITLVDNTTITIKDKDNNKKEFVSFKDTFEKKYAR